MFVGQATYCTLVPGVGVRQNGTGHFSAAQDAVGQAWAGTRISCSSYL